MPDNKTTTSSDSTGSLNKHDLGAYKQEKEARITRTSAKHIKEETLGIQGKSGVTKTRSYRIPESSLKKLAEQAKETDLKRLDTSEFKDLQVPISARDLEPSLDSAPLSQINKVTTEPSNPQTVVLQGQDLTMTSSDQRVNQRREIMKKMIQDYIISRGCITADHSIEYLLSIHSSNISNLTADLQMNHDLLDVYAKGWLDCHQQMGVTNLNTLSTKIDPLLTQMADIMIALRDNDVLKKIDELKSIIVPSVSETSKAPPPPPVSANLDRGKAPMVLDETPVADKTHTPLVAYDIRARYKKEWGEIEPEQRVRLAAWAGSRLLGVYTSEQMTEAANIKEVVKRMTGASLLYLLSLNTAKTHEKVIRALAKEMWEGKQ